MLALMLDPNFKPLQVVENYVVCRNATLQLNMISPFLITIFEQLNSNVQAYAIAPIDGLLLKLKMKN
jgi:hypothetical protein